MKKDATDRRPVWNNLLAIAVRFAGNKREVTVQAAMLILIVALPLGQGPVIAKGENPQQVVGGGSPVLPNPQPVWPPPPGTDPGWGPPNRPVIASSQTKEKKGPAPAKAAPVIIVQPAKNLSSPELPEVLGPVPDAVPQEANPEPAAARPLPLTRVSWFQERKGAQSIPVLPPAEQTADVPVLQPVPQPPPAMLPPPMLPPVAASPVGNPVLPSVAASPIVNPAPAASENLAMPETSGVIEATPGATAINNQPLGPIGPQTPSLYLETVGPASINHGKPFTYEIIARNQGSVAMTNVRVENDLPGGARLLRADPAPEGPNGPNNRLTWNLARLEVGGERRFKVEVMPTGKGELLSQALATFSVASGLQTHVVQPQLMLSQTGPENAQVGEPAIFHIRVTNTGDGQATHLVLHDRIADGLQYVHGNHIEADLGTLEPGATRELSLQTSAIRAGRQGNQVEATADDGIRASASTTVLVTEPSLVLHNTGPQRRFLNREADFTIEVSNPGTAPATNVHLIDTLPEGLEFVGASEGGVYEPTTRTVSWTVGILPPAQNRSLAIKTLPKGAGDLVHGVTAQADHGLEAKAETTLHVEGVPALTVEVVDLEDPIEVGAETTYEIHIVNQGTAPSTGVQVIASVPEGMVAHAATGPTPFRIQGQQVVFDPVAQLAPKGDCLFRVRVEGQKAGDLRFKVQMTCDQLHTPVYEEESTRVYSD